VQINGVAHTILRVTRYAECVEFYDQLMPVLGLETVHQSDRLTYYVGGRTAVAVARADPARDGHPHIEDAPGLEHLCFRAREREDVDELARFLNGIGADVVYGPQDGPWAPGYYSISFRDPEGIRLELNHVPGQGVLAEGVSFDPAGY
jgi:catechol 2,3-dioxygenase-like lactoylglutathione lyase family enzyme